MQDPLAARAHLVEFGARVLREHGQPADGAEDLVQDAYEAWCEAVAVRDPGAWLRGCMRNLARSAARRSRGERPHDPLEERHLSLDAPWARGGS